MAGEAERGVSARADGLTRVPKAPPCLRIRRRPSCRYRRCWVPLLLPGVLMVAGAMGAAAQTIVTNGRTDYVIVIPSDPIPAEEFAASELAAHVRQMSGADLPITRDTGALPAHAILLGKTRHLADLGVRPDWAGLGSEGYLLQTVGDRLIVAGGRPRGTLYGVYGLLEDHLGCRWFAPDATYVPATGTVAVRPLNTSAVPAFEYREPWMYQGYVWSTWWKDHFSADFVSRTRNSGNQLRQHVHPVDARHGGSYSVINFSHNMSGLVPASQYAKTHPEYFALYEGKRVTEGDLELCLSNPGVARAAAVTMAKWMTQNPDADMFFIGQSDTTRYCRCAKCETARRRYGGWDGARRVAPAGLSDDQWNAMGGRAGLNIEFVSRVASMLERRFPNKKIGTFAYSYSQRPPRAIKAHRNVVVWYCGGGCLCHSIDRGPLNDTFGNYAAEITSWRDVAAKVFVYTYWIGAGVGQPVDLLTLRDTVRAYHRAGVTGVHVDAMVDMQAGFGFLRYWLWTRLLRDPDIDLDKAIGDFLTHYYGAAGPYIRDYIALVSKPESWEPMSHDTAKEFTEAPYRPISEAQLLSCRLDSGRGMTLSALESGYTLLEDAKRAVRADDTLLRRVESARLPLQYTMLERLPAEDGRLKAEAVEFLRTWRRLECKGVGFVLTTIPLKQYTERLSKKIGIPLEVE